MSLKILIAAGGTGGHIYPALAMADAFRRKRADTVVEFVGTASGLENKIVPQHGYKVNHLSIGRLNRNVRAGERVKTVLKMPLAFFESFRLLRKFKPDFVLGVGGHASGPMLLVASLCGYRTGIWEPNAMPGLANRWLAKFVGDCWVVFDEAKAHMSGRRLHPAGMPVRGDIEAVAQKPAAAQTPFHVLIFGGSQGSKALNDNVMSMIKEGGWGGVHFVHQTGPADFQRVRAGYGENPDVEVREYLHDMPARYATADLVIARSGTGTLSELAACGKPAILIPLPTAADDHQRKNAESLVAKNAAVMILQKDLTPSVLRQAIEDLKSRPERRAELARHISALHQPRAAEKLVDEFVERIESHAIG